MTLTQETPRTARGDVGSIGQNRIRPDVAQQMADEMLCCDFDEFLHHYAPFCPTDDSIDSALRKLERGKFLTVKGWRGLSGNGIPSRSQQTEAQVFEKLKHIVKALAKQKYFNANDTDPRKCNFDYDNCGDTQMVGEIAGSLFRIDAYFSPKSPPPLCKSEKVVVSEVAVAAEFKKKEKDFYDVRIQILNLDVF